MGSPHEGSIRRPIAPWTNALTTELHLAPMSWSDALANYLCLNWNGFTVREMYEKCTNPNANDYLWKERHGKWIHEPPSNQYILCLPAHAKTVCDRMWSHLICASKLSVSAPSSNDHAAFYNPIFFPRLFAWFNSWNGRCHAIDGHGNEVILYK